MANTNAIVVRALRSLPVFYLLLVGCTRELPKPEKKAEIPVVEAPSNPPSKKLMKTLPEDPNRNLPPSKVEANPDLSPDPQLGKKPVFNTGGNGGSGGVATGNSNSNGGRPSSGNNPGNNLELKLHWDSILQAAKLTDAEKIKERFNTVKALFGDKGEAEIQRWVKSDDLHNLFKNFRFEVIENGEKLMIKYSFFSPNERDEKAGISVYELPFVLTKELTLAELENGTELGFVGNPDEKIKKSITDAFGKISVRKIKTPGDFLIVHERADGLGFGMVFHYDKNLLGSFAPWVQAIGMDENHEILIKDFNLVSFVEIGRQKLLNQINPLISNIEKLQGLVAKSEPLKAEGFEKFSNFLYYNGVKNQKNEEGFLLRLKDFTTAPMERVMTVRWDEMQEAKAHVPMEETKALLGIDKSAVLSALKIFYDQIKEGNLFLESLKAEKPQIEVKEIMDLIASVKLDLGEVALAIDFIAREIISQPKAKPAAAPAPAGTEKETPKDAGKSASAVKSR